MRVMVLGAGGFVGSRVAPALRSAGMGVDAVSRRSGRTGGLHADITDPTAVAALFDRTGVPDAVVHLAAIAHQARGTVDARRYDRVNHEGVVNVLRAAERAGVERFVFFSSATVYGEEHRDEPVNEGVERRPVGPYARSKAAAEDACFRGIADGMACVVLRFPAIYAADWLLNVRKRAYVPFTGDRILLSVPGRPPRYSFCAVEHAIDAVRLAACGRLAPGAYNVADARAYTQREVWMAVARADGPAPRLPFPRPIARAAVEVVGAALPEPTRRRLREDYWKLFEGMVLDTTKIRAAGFTARARLDDASEAKTPASPRG